MNAEYGQPPREEGQQKPTYNNQQRPQNQGQAGGQKPPYTGSFPSFHSIISESKLRIAGEKDPNVQYTKGMPPSLALGREDTNPRFNVYPNMEGKTDPIIVRMDPVILEIVLDIVVEAAEAEPGFRKQVVTKNFDPEAKRVYDEAKMTIGKHRDNGVVYIRVQSMTDDEIPELNFTFASRSFLSIIQGDGVPLNPADFSSSYAKAWANKVRHLYNVMLGTMAKKKRFDNNRPGGNNNWQNRQGGNQQGGNNNYQQRQQNQNQDHGGNQQASSEPKKPTYSTDYPDLDNESL